MNQDAANGKIQFGIISDDLTGAMDAGAGFAGFGFNPFISLKNVCLSEKLASIISTNSRQDNPETAYRRVRREARRLAGLCVYKKIDSTLRGNVGTEIIAIMDALSYQKAVVCPAFPANGRLVKGGVLITTDQAGGSIFPSDDNSKPARANSIPALLQAQTDLPCGLVTVEDLQGGSVSLYSKIKGMPQRLIAIDALCDEHLLTIARAVVMSENTWLPCGSAGLARHMPEAFGYKRKTVIPSGKRAQQRPVLAVVGSRNPISARQISVAACATTIHVITVEPDEFIYWYSRRVGLSRITQEALSALFGGKHVILTTSFSRHLREMEKNVARLMAVITRRILKQSELSGLFLCGGDIAFETCRAMGVTGIEVTGEIFPGIAVGEAIRVSEKNTTIITKSGGFGGDTAILDSINCLTGGV